MLTTLRRAMFFGLLSGLLISGWPGLSQAQELSYIGASAIGERCLPALIKAFTAKTGLSFTKVEMPSSTLGFKALIAGETPITGLARALTAAEKLHKPYSIILGFDPIAIYVHENNPVKDISDEQLKDIFTGQITDWQEVGGAPGPITVVLANPRRDTVPTFQRMALGGADYAKTAAITETHEETLQYVAQHEGAITFAGAGYKTTGTHTVSVDKATPSLESVRSGSYRLQRPLLLVSREVPMGNIQKFFDFVQSMEGQAIVGNYFVPAISR